MSETDNRRTLSTEVIENQKKTYNIVPGVSLERLPKPSESQSIIINFYPNSFLPKTNKLIQTEVTESEDEEEEPVKYTKTQEVLACSEKKEAATETLSDYELRRIHERIRSLPSLARKISRQMSSPERKEERSSDYRKSPSNEKSKNVISTNRTQSDLERKKLEAELKAAEEIAKLKQMVIEKRLAVELASIQNNFDSEQKPTNSSTSHQNELRKIDELALRKQSMIETNLMQELETLDYQNRILQHHQQQQLQQLQQQQQQLQQQQQRSSPPPPPARVPSPTKLKGTFKADSSSSVVNNFKNMNFLDKKINLDKRFSNDMGIRNPSPTNMFYNDSRFRKDERYNTYAAPSTNTGKPRDIPYGPLAARNPPYASAGIHKTFIEPKYAKMQEDERPHWTFKSAISKLKRKIKPNSTRWTGQ